MEPLVSRLKVNRSSTIWARASERLSATLADADAARLLEVPPHTPLLQIARVAFTYHDRPVELRRSLVDTTAHEYAADLVKQ
jgi:GntR family transcriptional regulator